MFKKTDKYRRRLGGRFTKKYREDNRYRIRKDRENRYWYDKDTADKDKKRWFFKKDKTEMPKYNKRIWF